MTPSSPSPARIRRTQDIWNHALGILGSGTWSVSQGRLSYPDGLFPLLAERGEGCRLIDSNGQEFVDWIMGWGPVALGYAHPEVDRAVVDQLQRGALLSLLTPLEVEVAEKLRGMVPCAEAVVFGKNGSDVLAAAVRVARAHTGREVVLHYGYHGFHDWYMAAVPGCEGIPAALRELIRPFPYNDLDALAGLFASSAGRVAAVVMEPCNRELPAPGYLQGVRELCDRAGAVLIFDEIITGFRLARGGAQEAFGVLPDLACLGKALANGLPLSALVGRREVLASIARVGYGLTYRGESLSLAAARACLSIFEREPVAERLAELGRALRARFEDAARRTGVRAELVGPEARLTCSFAPAGGLSSLGLLTLFVQECCAQGVLTNGNFLSSTAHDERALDQSAAAFERGLEAVARAVEARSFEGLLHVAALSIFGEDAELQEGPS